MRVPLTDPGATYARHREELDAAVRDVLGSGWYILGEQVGSFEREFASAVGVGHAIGVGNGTDALELALRGCGVVRRDEVLTVSHTAVATVAAIERAGATPVLVDIDEDTMTIDLRQAERAIERRQPRAVVVVHLYGHPVDMTALTRMAARHGTMVIEDCAQAHGAEWDGRRVGSFGNAAAFSFYPTKSLGGFGDGGAVTTTSDEVAERVRSLRQYGWRERYVSDEIGMNSRLDELQAAILRVLLPHLDADNRTRREVAARYDQELAGHGLVLPPSPPPHAAHAYHQYVVRTSQRDELAATLREAGIGTAVLYPVPVHLQPAYQGRVETYDDLPATVRLREELLCLPMGPHLTDADVDHVIAEVQRWAGAA